MVDAPIGYISKPKNFSRQWETGGKILKPPDPFIGKTNRVP
jgi:hypothetical protein